MVERDLAKVDVAGSTPVSRSKVFQATHVALFISPQTASDGLFLRITLT